MGMDVEVKDGEGDEVIIQESEEAVTEPQAKRRREDRAMEVDVQDDGGARGSSEGPDPAASRGGAAARGVEMEPQRVESLTQALLKVDIAEVFSPPLGCRDGEEIRIAGRRRHGSAHGLGL